MNEIAHASFFSATNNILSSSSLSRHVDDRTKKKQSIHNFSNSNIGTTTAQFSSSTKNEIFDTFASLLRRKQKEIIDSLEEVDGSGERFSNDPWGCFVAAEKDEESNSTGSGGITRVVQKGNVIEKGAVSLTVIRGGILSAERAKSIQDRNTKNVKVKEGDEYCAAALSLVLHSRSPMVPTFRSDVRLFLVKSPDDGDSESNSSSAWFGGGADLTPYYLFEEDIIQFHNAYKSLCQRHDMDYAQMKRDCDNYFFLPARGEHRGTGGIFFDDMVIPDDDEKSHSIVSFVEELMDLWMPSWIGIVKKRNSIDYTDQQRNWQLLRRGRYLEFNLLYDRGVRFGLVGRNPRVEGVMVSAPPLIAWEYNHKIKEGSEEANLMQILKEPRDWAE